MGKIVDVKTKKIKTSDGRIYIRRMTTVLCPNGKYRYPIDYIDATRGPVVITKDERERIRIPVYKELIP